jgi:hypothetical protein
MSCSNNIKTSRSRFRAVKDPYNVSVLRTIENGSQEKSIADREEDGFGERKHSGEIKIEREIEVSSAEVKHEPHPYGW